LDFTNHVWSLEQIVGLLGHAMPEAVGVMLRWLALILAWYGLGLVLLYVTDVSEKRRYRGRVGLRRLLLHGLFLLPITALISIYIPFYI
jgi:hypothetical protein